MVYVVCGWAPLGMFLVLSRFLRQDARSLQRAPVETAMGTFVPSDICQYSIAIKSQMVLVPG